MTDRNTVSPRNDKMIITAYSGQKDGGESGFLYTESYDTPEKTKEII
jgi:hypothetical protein